MLDRARLTKVLAMTASPNDGEALAAVRKANEIIASEDLSWDEVLEQRSARITHVTIQREPYMPEDDWSLYIRSKRQEKD